MHPRTRSDPEACDSRLSDSTLPVPDSKARARSDALRRQLQTEIARFGPMPFARYMERVLYTPELGYYCSEAPKFGASGDFVTAPEISPLFAQCLARPIANVLHKISADQVVEIGAGSGNMAADLLASLESLARPLRRYTIVETSSRLRQVQKQTLQTRAAAMAKRVRWRDCLPEHGFRGVILANEVLDAMPAHRFRMTSKGVQEWYVAWESEDFTWTLACPADPTLEQAVMAIERDLSEPIPQGYDSEVNLRHDPWLRDLAQRLEAGLILLMDYGYGRREYYHPQRSAGTLMCYYRHRAHSEPLLLPGLQDISVHVDFTTIAEAAIAAGLDIAFFTTQASFLLATGLPELLAKASADPVRYRSWARQVRRLMLPGEMGELVKVMALTRGITVPLAGFVWRDLRNRL